jgi:hypothetical protein
MVADVAIHEPVPEKGDDPRNHHAHVMLTMRQATRTGLRPVKTREWNSDALLRQWRAQWAGHQNRALERVGQVARVDHRTLERQRSDAIARKDRVAAAVLDRQPEIHIGPEAIRVARKRPPQSRDHEAGPRRQARRVIRYKRIDRGSRVGFNHMRVERNAIRLSLHIAKWRWRLVRLSQARLQQNKLISSPRRMKSLRVMSALIRALLHGLRAESMRLRGRQRRLTFLTGRRGCGRRRLPRVRSGPVS